MSNKLYRILNEEESYDILYTSYINQSARKNKILEFYEQIEKVCKLSQECICNHSSYSIHSFTKFVKKLRRRMYGRIIKRIIKRII